MKTKEIKEVISQWFNNVSVVNSYEHEQEFVEVLRGMSLSDLGELLGTLGLIKQRVANEYDKRVEELHLPKRWSGHYFPINIKW